SSDADVQPYVAVVVAAPADGVIVAEPILEDVDRVLGLVVVDLAERDHDHATLAVEPRVVSGSSEPIVCRVQSTRLHPLTRDLIRLTVLDRFEPLFAGIRVLRPSVRDHVAAAVRADLGDDHSAAVTAD